MSQNVNGTFISEKPNKIRWRPDPLNYSNSFITGSWDNASNNIKLWDFHENEDDMEFYPFLVKNYAFDGDVTEIKFLNPDLFVASSSLGSVFLFKILNEFGGDLQIEEKHAWNTLFTLKNGEMSACTALDLYDNDLVAVGENGQISLLNCQQQSVVRTIDEASSCSFNAAIFLKCNEILTGDLRGQMKIWDLRSADNDAAVTFMLNTDQIAATCVALHPNQRHMVIAGDEEGSLTVWDLRQSTFPVNLLNAHAESISELKFHPDHPDQLFSCSYSGEVWHWMTNQPRKHGNFLNVEETETNPWFSAETIKNKLEVFVPMPTLHKPINSLDVDKNRLLCACDNEAIYLISNINVY